MGQSQSTLQDMVRTLDFLLKPLEGVEESSDMIWVTYWKDLSIWTQTLGVQEEKPETSEEAAAIIQGQNNGGLDQSDKTESCEMSLDSEYILKVDKISKAWVMIKDRN